MNKERSSYSILWMLTIVFIMLKLTGNITWSWWWIASPILIPFIAALLLLWALFLADRYSR